MTVRRNTRVIVGAVATLLILVPLAVMWLSSLAPASYSVMAMGGPNWAAGPMVGCTPATATTGGTARRPSSATFPSPT